MCYYPSQSWKVVLVIASPNRRTEADCVRVGMREEWFHFIMAAGKNSFKLSLPSSTKEEKENAAHIRNINFIRRGAR